MIKRAALLTALCLVVTPQAQAQDGSSCAQAIVLHGSSDLGKTYTADTTAATNWMTAFGPLVSPSNDIIYALTWPAGVAVGGDITPTFSNYVFALYLIPSCSETGTEPAPIGATGTIANGINLGTVGVTAGNTYFLAVTGAAAGGAGANGQVTFVVQTFPVTLQSFEID